MLMQPFSPTYCAVFALFLLVLILSSRALRDASEATRRRVLIAASLVTLVGFFVYKGFLGADPEFDRLTSAMGGFNWWGELPLQLCNINMLLIPVAVYWDIRPLKSFCFFVGPLGALMALLMPGARFSGFPLWLPRMLGFYGTHFAVLIEGLALMTFGLYKPKFRDLPMTVLALLLITLIVFGVNMLLRATGLHPRANYFFSVETEGNPLLEIFYRWIPVPFLYLMPGVIILAGYMALVMAVTSAADRLRAKG